MKNIFSGARWGYGQSDCSLGQLKRIFETSDSDAGLKVEKVKDIVDMPWWPGWDVQKERDEFRNFICRQRNELSEAVSE